MGLSAKLFIRPALRIVGELLIRVDKNTTGLDDVIGHKLIDLSEQEDLFEAIKDFLASDQAGVESRIENEEDIYGDKEFIDD